MDKISYLRVYEPEAGMDKAAFSLFLPAGGEGFYTEYCFAYEKNPPEPTLPFGKGPNNPANRDFYRIRMAFVVRKEGEAFVPCFRALQRGEIGLALREQGAGDFVGGFHGDEVMTAVSLSLNGEPLPLDKPFFGTAEGFRFVQHSRIYRCNTPSLALAEHHQIYTLAGDRLLLNQEVRWLADTLPIQAAYMPMLTAQRLDPDDTDRILSDTVELYAPDGTLAASFDTSPYGTVGNPGAKGDDTIAACKNTFATAAKVYGKNTGFVAECGYTVLENTIPDEQISTYLCIRFMPHTLDNKIYFRIWAGEGPKAGTTWKSDVFYRIGYCPTAVT